MKVFYKMGVCLIMLAAMTGCAHQIGVVRDGGNIPDKSGMSAFFILGIAPQNKEIDAASICGTQKVSQIEAHRSVGNVLLGGLTFNLWSPRTYRVYCTSN